MRLSKKSLIIPLIFFTLTGCGDTDISEIPVQKQQLVEADLPVVAQDEVQPFIIEPPAKIQFLKHVACELFTDEKNRSNCNERVTLLIAELIDAHARSHFNLPLCAHLPEKMMLNCLEFIRMTGVENPITDDEKILFEKAYNFTPENGDEKINSSLSRCNFLVTPGLKKYCDKTIKEASQ